LSGEFRAEYLADVKAEIRVSIDADIRGRNEGEAYARKLKSSGDVVTAVRYNGMIHDFVLLNAIHEVPGVQAALQQASEAIRETLKP